MGAVKKRLLIAAAALVVVGVAYAFGRYSAPPKVVEKEKIVERVVERVDEKKLAELTEHVRHLRSQLVDVKKSIHREERTITHPSGLVETTKVEDINVSKVVKEQEVQFVDREVKVIETKYVDRVVEKEVVREKTVEAVKPQWRLTPMVGVNAQKILKSEVDVIYGVVVERRIIGPISGGGWVLSNGTAGVSVSLEF